MVIVQPGRVQPVQLPDGDGRGRVLHVRVHLPAVGGKPSDLPGKVVINTGDREADKSADADVPVGRSVNPNFKQPEPLPGAAAVPLRHPVHLLRLSQARQEPQNHDQEHRFCDRGRARRRCADDGLQLRTAGRGLHRSGCQLRQLVREVRPEAGPEPVHDVPGSPC